MSEMTAPTPIAWMRRPDGGRMFSLSARHLYDSDVDLDSLPALATLCGTAVPGEILRALRTGATPGQFASVATVTDRDMAETRACRKCERAAKARS